jgi:lipoprotein-anchoring transpeptidase ErfK/SrfK
MSADALSSTAVALALDASPPLSPIAQASTESDAAHMYREMSDRGFRIAAVDAKGMPATHVRQVVDYRTDEKPGTVVVDQKARYLYFVMPHGKAMRYAIGVGQSARVFRGGDAVIARKAAWPRWVPTENMIRRNPKQYERFRNGVAGGPGNPMGARALYMHRDGRDTYYRVHGTNDPSSIRKAVSAGCIRLLNQDIIDLHDRVSLGARIVVI